MTSQQPVPALMKALRLVEFNKNYQLRDDIPVPSPERGELLVRVAAASFCHTDYQVYQGTYGTQLPFTGSHEPAGTVAALGPGVDASTWRVGDRVGVLNFRKPCGACAGCKWRKQAYKSLDARFCENKTMSGIQRADGGFAEYMLASQEALVHLPDSLSFEQAAPLMCAGATIWNAIQQTGATEGQTLGIVGVGGLGVLGIQMAKARGLRVVAIDKHDAGLRLANNVPEHLRPDLVVNISEDSSADRITEFADGIGLSAAVTCTDDVGATDWILHRLHPQGVCVVLGLPDTGFKFDAFNLVFREIVVKGSLHCSVDDVKDMVDAVAHHGIISHVTIIQMEEGEDIPQRAHNRSFTGRLVVRI
ncbi:hypothetical protein FOVSG1_011149 [Fusarium oxysporum f. sp. vasinfectum]